MGLKRVRYFDGQMLTADDFRDEQQYWREMHRRHNQLLHGWGIVAGLGLTAGPGDTVTVGPGLALDPIGREVSILAPVTVPVTGAQSPQLVLVSFCERDTDPVPVPGASGGVEPSRVEEGASVNLAKRVDAESVAVGRIVRGAKGWKVDRAFRPRKVRR